MSELKVHASKCDIEPMVQSDDLRKAFSSRLKKALANAGIPEWGAGARLAKITGKTPKAASKWLNEESMPGRSSMADIAKALSVRVEWLQYGVEPIADDQVDTASKKPYTHETPPSMNVSEISLIPQYTASASAGEGADNDHVEIRGKLAFKSEWIKSKRLDPSKLHVIYAHGESMAPTINDCDVILIDERAIEPVCGGVFALLRPDGKMIVKRVVRSEVDNEWIIRSDNPDKITYPDVRFPSEQGSEVLIKGRVIWRGGDL